MTQQYFSDNSLGQDNHIEAFDTSTDHIKENSPPINIEYGLIPLNDTLSSIESLEQELDNLSVRSFLKMFIGLH